MSRTELLPDTLAAIATGREVSFFSPDLAAGAERIRERVSGKRVLAIGAAGSIGSSTAIAIAAFDPAALHVIDHNENALAELVRRFRSSPTLSRTRDLRALPLDYGSAATELFLAQEGPYDIILNFAAIKHVRSEKDDYSIIQMIDTNIVKQARLMCWIARHAPAARYFSVSTDKAANPSSFMGATKRLMEHVAFHTAFRAGLEGPVTSARFANVAYSNGSLLQSFENRLARREPIAAPRDIRRYFVSLAESGEICTLASLLLASGHVGIPNLDPETCLVPLSGIAEGFIRANGYEPHPVEDEDVARRETGDLIAAGRWPLILTPGDTAGEKPYEEFVAEGETVVKTELASMSAIPYRPPETGDVGALVAKLEDIVLGRAPAGKDRIKAMIGEIEPRFLETHRESALGLDQRM